MHWLGSGFVFGRVSVKKHCNRLFGEAKSQLGKPVYVLWSKLKRKWFESTLTRVFCMGFGVQSNATQQTRIQSQSQIQTLERISIASSASRSTVQLAIIYNCCRRINLHMLSHTFNNMQILPDPLKSDQIKLKQQRY